MYAKLSVRKECHWTRVRKVLLRTACCRFLRQSCSTVAAGLAPFATVTTTRCWRWILVGGVCEYGCLGTRKFCHATWRAYLLNSTQCPLLRLGDGTYSFSSALFCASCGRFWMYVLPTQGELLFIFPVSVGRHFVFRPTWREKLLLPS